MTQQKIILNYLRELRLKDEQFGYREGFRKKHELLNNKDGVFITLRGADRTLRDLVEAKYLERKMDGRFAEYRYTPRPENEPEEHNEEDRVFWSINGCWPEKHSQNQAKLV